MKIYEWQLKYKDPSLSGRHISSLMVQKALLKFENFGTTRVLGFSENGLPITIITFGNGPEKVLAWSQMHGNETTATKAIFDFISFMSQKQDYQENIQACLDAFTFCFIPQLNPDGADVYTRFNAKGVDLNRDAINLSQSESKILWSHFNTFKPSLCLNLHDQRTIFGLSTKKPATLSFLAPAANETRSITASRKVSIQLIEKINAYLQVEIPNQIGRYNDAFNLNCVGDRFQKEGVPTILFEAGHFSNDYEREYTRYFVFYSFLALFNLLPEKNISNNLMKYGQIPENQKNFRDILLRNASIGGQLMDVAIQFKETLREHKVIFIPVVDSFGDLQKIMGHKELQMNQKELLLNSQEFIAEGMNISEINIKSTGKTLIL